MIATVELVGIISAIAIFPFVLLERGPFLRSRWFHALSGAIASISGLCWVVVTLSDQGTVFSGVGALFCAASAFTSLHGYDDDEIASNDDDGG